MAIGFSLVRPRACVVSLRTTAAAAIVACASPLAWGGAASFGDDVNVEYTLTLNYGLAARTKRPADALVDGGTNPQTGLPFLVNGDDGDRNFKRGALINNRISALGELKVSRGETGLMIRGSGFYDDVYRHGNDNDSPGTVNKAGDPNAFTDGARKYMGSRARLLDTYVFGSFNLGESNRLTVRLGDQVVQWGESVFFPNIAGAQGPADATKANLPGVEVKDILLPVGQISTQLQLGSRFTLLGYYQYKYKPTELDPAGAYFSYADVIGPGAEFIRAAPGFNISRGPDVKARDSGQWGVGMRWRASEDTELGLYHLRYHDKTPSVVTNFTQIPVAPFVVPTSYQVRYLEDIKLTGMSLATRAGPTSVGAEVSYKQDVPVLVNSLAGPVPTRANALQAQANFLYIAPPNALVRGTTTWLGELVYLKVNDVKSTTVFGVSTNDLNAKPESLALQVMATPSVPNVFSGWDLDLPVVFARVLQGRSPVAGGLGSLVGKGDTRLSIGANFKYLSNLELAFNYAMFLGGADPTNRPLADRDYVSLNVKYSF